MYLLYTYINQSRSTIFKDVDLQQENINKGNLSPPKEFILVLAARNSIQSYNLVQGR